MTRPEVASAGDRAEGGLEKASGAAPGRKPVLGTQELAHRRGPERRERSLDVDVDVVAHAMSRSRPRVRLVQLGPIQLCHELAQLGREPGAGVGRGVLETLCQIECDRGQDLLGPSQTPIGDKALDREPEGASWLRALFHDLERETTTSGVVASLRARPPRPAPSPA